MTKCLNIATRVALLCTSSSITVADKALWIDKWDENRHCYLLSACMVHCDLHRVCLQLSQCATGAFPWECGLLFRTPGIARGLLLAQLMWAEQRGNKKDRKLQIIAEQKTSWSFAQALKVFSLKLGHKQAGMCGQGTDTLQTACRAVGQKFLGCYFRSKIILIW